MTATTPGDASMSLPSSSTAGITPCGNISNDSGSRPNQLLSWKNARVSASLIGLVMMYQGIERPDRLP